MLSPGFGKLKGTNDRCRMYLSKSSTIHIVTEDHLTEVTQLMYLAVSQLQTPRRNLVRFIVLLNENICGAIRNLYS